MTVKNAKVKKPVGRPRKNPATAPKKAPVPGRDPALAPAAAPAPAPAPTPAAAPSAPVHAGNDEARERELAALAAEAEARATPAPQAAPAAAPAQPVVMGKTQQQIDREEVAGLIVQLAEPTVLMLAPNWHAHGLNNQGQKNPQTGELMKSPLQAWAEGITPALLKWWPDLATNFPPELLAAFVTVSTFAPFAAGGIPPRLPAPKPETTATPEGGKAE